MIAYAIYKRPLLISLLVAVGALVLTQLLVYEQYRLLSAAKRHRLAHELSVVDSRFRGIMLGDITAANALAIFYKHCGVNSNFDSVAKDIMDRNKYVDGLQISENGIAKYLYPVKGREILLRPNTLRDTLRKSENNKALLRNDIYFAGPRKLRTGGVGILGKVPIVADGKLVAVAIVLTRLQTITDALMLADSNRHDYAYQIKKIARGDDTTGYFLTADRPDKRSAVESKEIPEGEWLLSVSYSHDHLLDFSLLSLSVLGILFSFVLGRSTYRRLAEPFTLQKVIDEKTADLKELNAGLENRVAQRTEEINNLNLELKSHVQDLEMANKDLESFSYTVSHDLRAPLRNINGYIGLLERDSTNMGGDAAIKYLASISGLTKKMGSLIEDLLAFAKVGKKELEKASLDMNALLADALEGINVLEWNSHTTLEVGNMLPAVGDYSLLKQVFVNLISNAVKYSRTKENPLIQIGSSGNGDENIYYVRDNGVGFSMEYYDKLFQVFQRLHSSSEFEGVGIGLAIVARIVMKHGGKIWAESKVDEGATFYFTLPAIAEKITELSS